jgi:uncharacterized membrane protein YfcA
LENQVDTILQFFSGGAVGLSLGLTGGGGSLLAVPLLVYVVGQNLHMALGTSLASVGATSLSGALRRMAEGQVAIRTGVLFAALGGAGTHLGTRMNAWVSGPALLILMALVIGFVAVRMWRKSAGQDKGGGENSAAEGRTRPLLMVPTAFVTGIASGFFGIGGGFLIVPALALVGGLAMGTAIATSLLVISINGAVGVASYALQGRPIDYSVAGMFIAGGLAGMWLGQKAGGRLNERALARLFTIVLILVAGFLLYKNLWVL